jgi:Bacterial SH3 domain/WD40-like Beta Propeller Repeat
MKVKVFVLLVFASTLFLDACAAGATATPPPTPPTATPPSSPTPSPTPTILPPTATPAPPTATPPPPIATTKIAVNVRAGPGVSYPLIGKLKRGDKQAILGKSADSKWWQIDLDGRSGWIPADFTDVQGGTNFVAIISVEPTATATPVPTRISYARPTPTDTPTLQIPAPAGRVYFVIEQSIKWLAPTAADQVFPDVAIGSPGDLDPSISTNASPLDWSDDGRLAFVSGSGGQDKLHVRDSSNDRVIASHGTILTPRWFGGGGQLAFVAYDNNSQSQNIYIVSASDGRAIQTCPARRGEQLRGLAVNKKTGDIAFVSNFSGRFEIWKMDRSCNSPVQLTHDNADASAPAFSTDGARLAYVSNKDSPSEHQIYVMPANGGNAVQLGPGESFAPAFSPDGYWLTFAHNLEVYIMDITGGNIQPLTPGDRPMWAP